jgi:hypothetical protein
VGGGRRGNGAKRNDLADRNPGAAERRRSIYSPVMRSKICYEAPCLVARRASSIPLPYFLFFCFFKISFDFLYTFIHKWFPSVHFIFPMFLEKYYFSLSVFIFIFFNFNGIFFFSSFSFVLYKRYFSGFIFYPFGS